MVAETNELRIVGKVRSTSKLEHFFVAMPVKEDRPQLYYSTVSPPIYWMNYEFMALRSLENLSIRETSYYIGMSFGSG